MFRFLLLIAVGAAWLTSAAAQGVNASALFADGERAFAAGDYREALRLFGAARDAGSRGPGSYYNIGVSQYLLRDFHAAEQTFASLAAEFPAMRELAEYNRGLALRAAGDIAAARVAFERARPSADDKIAALASAQLRELGAAPRVVEARWQGYFSGGVGYDDNVALVDDALLPAGDSSSSPLTEALGLLGRDFGVVPLRFDATGYVIRYADAGELDQSALRLALVTQQRFGAWTFSAGPTLARTTLDGDGFEELVGADLRARRAFGDGLSFEARLVYDDVEGGASQYGYLDGWRRQLRLSVQHTGDARLRVGYDLERNDRANAGVSPSRQRWTVAYQRAISAVWSADASLAHRTSRYAHASVPREERLVELSFAARRNLAVGWALSADYRWSDNDSTVGAYSYDGQRIAVGLSRTF